MSLQDDFIAVISTPVVVSPVVPYALGGNTISGALYSVDEAELHPKPRLSLGKRHRLSRKNDLTNEELALHRQHILQKKANKDSIIDEQIRQQRVHEIAAGESSSILNHESLLTESYSMSTAKSTKPRDLGTIESDPLMLK